MHPYLHLCTFCVYFSVIDAFLMTRVCLFVYKFDLVQMWEYVLCCVSCLILFLTYSVGTVCFIITVESGYLNFVYLEFCDTRTVYVNPENTLIAFSHHNNNNTYLALMTFYKSRLPEVQIIFHFV